MIIKGKQTGQEEKRERERIKEAGKSLLSNSIILMFIISNSTRLDRTR